MNSDVVVNSVTTLGGLVHLAGHPDDNYYAHVVSTPGAELDLITIMSLVLESGSTFMDVGANIGFETILAAKMVGSSGSVVSFEPSIHNHDLLRRNIDLNGVEQTVQTFAFGLSDVEAEHTLHFRTDNRGGAFLSRTGSNEFYETEEPVHVKILDDLNGDLVERCDLIKVDIEGHEPNFLRGALRFLTDISRPAFLRLITGVSMR